MSKPDDMLPAGDSEPDLGARDIMPANMGIRSIAVHLHHIASLRSGAEARLQPLTTTSPILLTDKKYELDGKILRNELS